MNVSEPGVGSSYGQEELDAIQRVLGSGESLARGPERPAFEAEFAHYCGAKHALAVSSCTAALQICAQLLRLGPEDEVICTPQSFWATVVSLVARGVRIRFADIDPRTLNLDPSTVPPLIGPRTRAIYVLHHGGNPADLTGLREVAAAHGLPIIEDCAHASGANHRGRMVGSGDLCCFSFHSLKNITTLGMGGMLTTDSDEWAEEASRYRAMGLVGETAPRAADVFSPYARPDFDLNDQSAGSWDFGYERLEGVGTNFGMGEVQAAVGRVQLRKLSGVNERRARVAARYDAAIAGIEGLSPLFVHPEDRSAWHLHTCFVDPDSGLRRDELARYLQERAGIGIVLRYWPLHLHAGLQPFGHRFGECPVCERVWFESQLNLPIGPDMPDGEVDYVCAALRDGAQTCRR